MIYEVELSEQADSDLRGIFEYISFELQSPENASGQLDRLEEQILSLDTMPEKKFLMPAFIMGGNVMGTALVMEHANALAQMIVSEKDKLFDERVEALVKLYRRAEFYLKQGFLESIVCEFHRKKVEMIMQAETKGEITEILKLSKPHFDGKKFVYTSPYAVEEEELLLWSLTSLQGPLRDEGYRRYRELFEKCLPEMAEKIPA